MQLVIKEYFLAIILKNLWVKHQISNNKVVTTMMASFSLFVALMRLHTYINLVHHLGIYIYARKTNV